MTNLSRRSIFWVPRVLSMAFIAFISMFALDAFADAHGFWGILLALGVHLIPAFILTLCLVLAWRWEWVGAVLYGAAGMSYVVWVLNLPLPAATKLNWTLIIAAPAFALAALFLANWLNRDQLHVRHS